MSLLHISELAERSGVPSSTLRYYERIGLVEPAGRATNGYRVYDESAVDRLAFIARAKRLGIPLDDVATLVEARFAGECAPLQDRLRTVVTGRLADVRDRIAQDAAFERQLRGLLARLEGRDDPPEQCDSDCGCDADPLDPVRRDAGIDGAIAADLGCSLEEHAMKDRLLEWRRVVAAAVETATAEGEVRFVFDASPAGVAELARLCAAETACCPVFTFNLTLGGGSVVLTVTGGTEEVRLFAAGTGAGATPDR